ncbi:Hsp20/alpha crystallin family protein [Arthrobacter sp. ISL-72]|uniref:Hsp20/alpha crystallin family protein n=1 Tax=Arthrobacter sp. ISL-72 TaxID=2819114 RepID=UPI001BE803DB|nr:Hsp20/alpha crystallin family protein [Arthrobacter sp. ISL-72]MBT2597323.1 Hsp20/alpha crystallin family protein [Arthrobacter sp. ISL-72]
MSGALKWSPFEPARWPSAQDGSGRTTPEFVGGVGRTFSAADEPANLRTEEVTVDEYVDQETLVVRAELPGADPDGDIQVAVAGSVPQIRAGLAESHDHPDSARLRSGLRYRPFTRNLPVPAGVTETDIKVSFREGVLEVRTPLPGAPGTDAAEKRLPISRD